MQWQIPISAAAYVACAGALLISANVSNAATVLTGDAEIVPRGTQGDLINVGRVSTGTATFSGGEVVVLQSGTSNDEFVARPKIDVGEYGGDGKVTITDPGTRVELLGTTTGSKFEIGDDPGTVGRVVIQDGAEVIMRGAVSSSTGEENIYIQFGEDGGVGYFTVDGATLDAEGSLDVGILAASNPDSTGYFVLEDGSMDLRSLALPGSGGAAYAVFGVGPNALGFGTITNSTLSLSGTNAAGIGIGYDGGSGDVVIDAGSTVSFDGVFQESDIGEGGGEGSLTIANGSELVLSGSTSTSLDIGDSGAVGYVTIESGSRMEVTNSGSAGALITVGPGTAAGSTSRVLVDGAGSEFVTDGAIVLGTLASAPADTRGELQLNGGYVEAFQVVVAGGGALTGTGTVNALTTLNVGGTIAPGLSPGELLIDGDLEVLGGTISLEVNGAGPGAYDLLRVTGDIIATSAFAFEIILDSLFDPAELAGLTLVEAGSFDPSFFDFARVSILGQGGFNGSLVFTEDGIGVAVTPVPLPAGFLLLLSSLAGVFALRRQRTS